MSYILSTKHARKTDCDFIVAAARAFYCDWYLSDERRAAAVEYPGCELTEVIPETQRWAFKLAREFALRCTVRFAEARGHYSRESDLSDMLDSWCDLADASENGDREPTAENFGWYAAMQAMGHGVGLDDAFGFRVELPHTEAYPR